MDGEEINLGLLFGIKLIDVWSLSELSELYSQALITLFFWELKLLVEFKLKEGQSFHKDIMVQHFNTCLNINILP